MLAPYRVLDLTTNGSAICGAILGDLGADVIAVEPGGGSPLRREGPFRHDEPDIETSLTWWAYSRNKRSVELDMETAEGRAALLGLVGSSDILIESFAPGYLAGLGLGYRELSARNPRLVMVSITPFGSTGPKANWAATDITVWASSGAHYLAGDEDRAPVRVSVPQAFLHAGAEAATGALVALAARERTGMGQHVDVSAQAACMAATQSVILAPAWNSPTLARSAGGLKFGPLFVRFVYPCKDGYVNITLLFGNVLGQFTKRLFAWMCEEGFVDEATRDKDWVSYVELLVSGQEPLSEFLRAMQAVEAFTRSHTKDELLQGTFDRHVLIVPVSTAADVSRSPQLAAREYWERLAQPVANELTPFPGPFARFSRSPISYRRRPPRLNEHAGEVVPEPRASKSAPPSDAGQLPLAGLKVCDFSWVYAGPAATKVLADWGATVVKVESTRYLDALRTGQPYKDNIVGPERSANFCNVNLGKLGITLDLGKPEGRQVATRLAEWADVVVENFTPGAMAGWGLDYETLAQRNPGLIMLSTCLSGATGPQAALAGYGTMGAALAGFHELTGWADRPPAGPFLAYTDYVSPRFMSASVLAALDHRRRTGQGQHIDLSQGEASLHFLAPALLDYAVNHRLRTRDGNNSEEYAPHGVYPCAGNDRWIAIAAPTHKEWVALAEAAEHPEWLRDERFREPQRRYANRNALSGLISEWTSEREVSELEELLQPRGVPAHRVSDSSDVCGDPQLAATGHFVQVDQPEAGRVTVEAPRFKLSGVTPVLRPAPTLGQHNDLVLREILGMNDEEIAELAASGVLE